jgi:hypothetical protein
MHSWVATVVPVLCVWKTAQGVLPQVQVRKEIVVIVVLFDFDLFDGASF